MGYFDGLTDVLFKKDEKGNTIFYPWGILGKGYVIPDDKKDGFRLIIKRLLLISVPLAITFSMFMSLPRFFLIIVPLYFFICAIWLKVNTRGLAKSSEKLNLVDTTKNSPNTYNQAIFWLLDFVAFLFILASIFLLGKILADLVKN